MKVTVADPIFKKIPHFKVGIIFYKDIVVAESPQMLKGRLRFFQEKIKTDLFGQTILDYPGIREWRDTSEQAGLTDQCFTHESLFQSIRDGKDLPFIHSAADLTTFFSLQFEIPISLYDFDTLRDYIKISFQEEDEAAVPDGAQQNRHIMAYDKNSKLGGPADNFHYANVTIHTTNAIQLFYLRPSMDTSTAKKLLDSASKMFTQIHSGTASPYILHEYKREISP
ncbi:hypothetical protein [Bacillus piscicola]|uniref:hypothetical protein n=1 Tax=Bacillus piscicola TaxID=1632684 RepID=UPI001F0941AA|nr:hypothetical protein [Bacillus piscicola]